MNKIIVDKDALNNVLEKPEHRKLAYKIYSALGILLALFQTGFAVYGYDAIWFNATVGVYLFLAIPFGGLALTNTPGTKQQEEVEELDTIVLEEG